MRIDEAGQFGASLQLLRKLAERQMLTFTKAQEACLRAGLCTGTSLLVSAPTSSGKTTIAELAAVEGALKGYRTVYLVSHRALAEEKFEVFSKEYSTAGKEWFEVSIATGDHVEGTWSSGILVATYEKYLAQLCTAADFDLQDKVVVADEIQILGDAGRGPEIELLMSLVRRGQPRQLVVLSATISNPIDVADWLGCTPIQLRERDVPLRHEVWYRGGFVHCDAGTEEVFEGDARKQLPTDTLEAVDDLLARRLGPILVFTMTKPRAVELAENYARRRKRDAKGLDYATQLELLSEPSTLVRMLTDTSQKGVAFHTADLSYTERRMVELGVRAKTFDVVFATPTLAAGVNFPFQTVLFDSFFRKFIPANPWLRQSEFHNMAGRAGRLGMHDRGYAILLARNEVDNTKAISLISSPVEPLHSLFIDGSIRKIVLTLISSRVVKNTDELLTFLKNTFWWYETADKNPKKLEPIPALLDEAVKWLADERLITLTASRLHPTRLGSVVASTGLLPQTAVSLLKLLGESKKTLTDDMSAWMPALFHAICACDEFTTGQRFLPYARNNQPEDGAWFWLTGHNLFLDPRTTEDIDKVANAAYALHEWTRGTEERVLRNMLPSITYGQLHQLGADVAWILDGVCRLMRLPELTFPLSVVNALSDNIGSLRDGLPLRALPLMRAVRFYDVPGVGRHRIMALLNAKIDEPNTLLKTPRATLTKIMESERRADELIEAVTKYFDPSLDALKIRHTARAAQAGIDSALISSSYDLYGIEYEDAIFKLLTGVKGLNVSQIDDGKRQGYPDILVKLGDKVVLLECKTRAKASATLNKEEAFAVLQKSTDFEKDHCVTVGKPDFDEFSKSKADGSDEITLIKHRDFIEAILKVMSGVMSVEQLFSWFLTPGSARLEQLEVIRLSDS